MKALFIWLDGPDANRGITRSAARIPLGPDGPESLALPGCPPSEVWALLEYENKHYHLTDLAAPEGLFVNETRLNRSQRVELRAGAILRVGPSGARLKFGFEVEPQDLLVQAGGAGYSPSEAMRRMEGHMRHSAVRPEEVKAVQKTVQDAEKRGLRRWGVAVLTGILGTILGITVTWVLVRRQEKKTDEKIAELSKSLINVESQLRAADSEFRRAVSALPTTEQAAKEKIAELDKRIGELRGEPDRNREELARTEAELKSARSVLAGLRNSERLLQEVYERTLPSLVFLWVEWDIEWRKQTYSMAGCGTGFVIDNRGTVVTAKHVVHPWKFAQTYLSLHQAGVSDWKQKGEPRIKAWQAGDAFVLETSGGRPVVSSTPRWSTEDASLFVRKFDDHLVNCNVLERAGGRLLAEIEEGFEHDVAILELKGRQIPGLTLASDEEIRQETLRPLTPILVSGFPLGSHVFENQKIIAQPTRGYVRKVERLIYHSVPSCPGNSGGPVLNEEGRVIGIVNGAYEQGQNMNLSLSAARIRLLLDR